MMRSLFSGVTGLRSHQTRMDVIGNNIANVNTVGFKKSAVTFKDLYSETVSAAAGPSGDGASGGVNPRQIGLGVTINSIATVHTPGAAQYTGNSMDVAISGDGFFVIETPTGKMYTRNGNFYLDTAGNLVTSLGHYVKVVDPVMDSDVLTTVQSVNVDNLFPANSPYFKTPASNVHGGKITADLTGIDGKNYGFKFIPDDTGFFSKITNNYIPGYDASNATVVSDTLQLDKTTIKMKGIADAYLALADNPPGSLTPGAKDILFNNTGTQIEMIVGGKLDNGVIVGGVVVATSDVPSSPGASTASPPEPVSTTVKFNSLAPAGGVLFEISFTDPEGNDIDVNDQLSILENLNNWPQIPIEEGGTWYLVDQGAVGDAALIEPVVLDYKTTISGGVAAGDILFTTSNYGTFRMNVLNNIESISALSTALETSNFSITTADENYAVYSSPAGNLAEGSLKNLNVDFDRYTNLAIDSKGAVIAQLKGDETLVINGRTIEMKLGDKVVLGYIALSNFNNPTGLEKMGDNLYSVSNNSGLPSFQMPGSGNVGELAPANLEMSNVDLSEEMVNMIITQRGFQANSRIITTSDTMLEELINLKR